MTTKYGHERRNRREKAWKESGCVGSTAESPGLWNFFTTPGGDVRLVKNQKIDLQMWKQEAVAFLETQLRRTQFTFNKHQFKYSWSVNEFAKANGLSLLRAKPTFDKVREEAEEKLRIVLQRLRRKPIQVHRGRDESGNLVEIRSLSFAEERNFLPIDKTK